MLRFYLVPNGKTKHLREWVREGSSCVWDMVTYIVETEEQGGKWKWQREKSSSSRTVNFFWRQAKIECFLQKTFQYFLCKIVYFSTTRGRCYQIYVHNLQRILQNTISIGLWIYKHIFCKLFFTKEFFSVICKLQM